MLNLKLLPMWLILLIFCPNLATCKEYTPKQVFIEAASQRAAIVSYDCDISMRIESEDEKDVILKGRVEVSKIDDSYCCIMYDPGTGEPMRFFGHTGDYGFDGRRDNVASYYQPRKGLKVTDGYTKALPDPLSSGFGFCSDIKRAAPSDVLIKAYQPFIDNFDFEVKPKGESKIALSNIGPIFRVREPEIIWDVKRDFWPIKSQHRHSDWDITLVKTVEYWMPEVCVINCLGDGSTMKRIEIDYRWHSVNEELTTGK